MKVYVATRQITESSRQEPKFEILGVFSTSEKARACIASAAREDTDKHMKFYTDTGGAVPLEISYLYEPKEFELDREIK